MDVCYMVIGKDHGRPQGQLTLGSGPNILNKYLLSPITLYNVRVEGVVRHDIGVSRTDL